MQKHPSNSIQKMQTMQKLQLINVLDYVKNMQPVYSHRPPPLPPQGLQNRQKQTQGVHRGVTRPCAGPPVHHQGSPAPWVGGAGLWAWRTARRGWRSRWPSWGAAEGLATPTSSREPCDGGAPSSCRCWVRGTNDAFEN